MVSMALSFPCAAASARLCPATPGAFAAHGTTTGRPWRVLPAVALGSAGWALPRRGPRGSRAVGFEVQEASAEEQEEYDKEKAWEE